MPTTVADPLAGGDTTAMLVTTPLICPLRLNANGVLNVTEPALLPAVGAAGAVTFTVTVAGDDVPPAPRVQRAFQPTAFAAAHLNFSTV